MLRAGTNRRASWLLLVLIATIVAAMASAQTSGSSPAAGHSTGILFWNASPKSVGMLLNSVPQRDDVRLAQLRQTFSDLQCRGSRLREQPAPEGKNLICTLPAMGPTSSISAGPEQKADPKIILFLAHYERNGSGQSAVEDWSGALMLPFLYHALSAAARRHTFFFAEVDGEAGADALYKSLTLAQRNDLVGVISLDALGLGPAQFYINPNDTYSYLAEMRLLPSFFQAAADQGQSPPRRAAPGGWFRVDAGRVFRHHNIPVMLIHSVDWDTRQVPGSVRDSAAAINRVVYMQTIGLLSDYAAELDRR